MNINKSLQAGVAALLVGFAGTVAADAVTLTFESRGPAAEQTLQDFDPIAGFYSDLGINFSANALAAVDKEAGGFGDFANEPSASTVMSFQQGLAVELTHTPGFTGGLSFYYSSSVGVTVSLHGLDGALLFSNFYAAQNTANTCVGDPEGTFCNWTKVDILFSGTAAKVLFAGDAGAQNAQSAFDNITVGTSNPGCTVNCNTVPEPASLALVGAALLGLGASRRRKL